MKKVFLFLMLAVATLTASAQDEQPAQQPALKFGYVSYEAVFQALPDYALVQANLTQLREKYETEQRRVENDFNKKYEEFLDGQRDFPQTILQKRQSELQEMLDKNIAFKKESQRLLDAAKAEAETPLKQKLAEALAKVGAELGLSFILNTDVNAVPWLNAEQGVDVTEAVKAAMQ